jgi:ATP-dependent Zn protease
MRHVVCSSVCRCMTPLPATAQVQVEVPDVQGRLDILKVHAKNKKLAEDVNLESVAMRVPGEQLYGPAALLCSV